MNIELEPSEVKEAIRTYLKTEKGLEVDEEDITFKISGGSSGSRPGSLSSSRLRIAECGNVSSVEDNSSSSSLSSANWDL